jgi:hypothetical protein
MLESTDDVSAPPTPTVAPGEARIALSIKQPWATLVVHGLKTIELRKWRPRRLGVLYIHTGAKPDESAEAWQNLPSHLATSAELRRGVIGRVQLVGTKRYESLDGFREDRGRHLASEEWFAPTGLFGWVFENAQTLPFEPGLGNQRLFRL